MKLFHPSTVLGVALLFVALLQVAVGSRFDREARTESPKGVLAGFPLDDAWIHQVYARSLLERGRPEYNPGVAEVGQSSLLWGLLLAPVQALATAVDVPVARATRMFGLVIAVLLALAVAWLVASLPVPGARFGALCGALLVALDPAIAFAAVSGMEPLLFALCLVLALAALVQGRPTLVGLAVGAAILARPEGLLAAAVLVPAAAFVQRREESPDSNARSLPRRAGRFARAAAPALVLAAVWGGLCLAVAGRPFPNTWYQKVADVPLSDAVGSGLELLGHAFTTSPFYENYLGYLFLLIGAIALVGRAPRTVWLVLLLFPPLSFVAVAATRAMPDPDAFFWERYLTPMLPLLHVPAAVGFAGAGAVLHDLLRKSRTRPSDEALASPEAHEADEVDPAAEATEPHGVDEARTPIELPRRTETLLVPDVVLVVALMLVAFVPFTPAPRRLAESAAEYGRNVRDVDALNVAAGEWLARSGLPRETLVASQDAGAVRWFAPYEVLDLLGLNDHRLVTAGLETGTIGPYLQQRNPDVLVLLDPDPGAVEFALWARAVGMRERARFTVDAYSLFGEPIAKSIVVLAR